MNKSIYIPNINGDLFLRKSNFMAEVNQICNNSIRNWVMVAKQHNIPVFADKSEIEDISFTELK
jgi:hypothetical protein